MAALAMRDVMSREEEPSFVIKDPRYVKESTNTTSLLQIFNGRWLVGFGVIAMSFVFGQLICIPTRLASSCKIVRASCSTHADGAKMAMSSAWSRSVTWYSPSCIPRLQRLSRRRMRWSITQLKRSGAMTHPCFTPVSTENSSDREEARRTALRVSVTDLYIYWTKHSRNDPSADMQGAAVTCCVPTGRCHDPALL